MLKSRIIFLILFAIFFTSSSLSYSVVTRNVKKIINDYYLSGVVKNENLLVARDVNNSQILYFINY